MSKLVALEPEPLGDTVTPMLKDVLAKAEAGEISSLGLAIVYRDGCVGQMWTDAANFGLLLGAAHRLAAQINAEMDE